MAGSAQLVPIRREGVPLAIARSLQAYIAGNGLVPGNRLPSERELAAALCVSRPALREAIKYLTALDVLTVRQGAGVFVLQAQHPALTHIGQLGSRERLAKLRQATLARRLIDVEVASRAAAELGPQAVARLDGYMARSLAEPLATLREHQLDLGFEAVMAELVADPYLLVLQRQAHRLFQDAWEGCSLIPRPVAERNAQHNRIVQAIRAGDVTASRRAMTAHFDHSLLATQAPGKKTRRGDDDGDHTA